MATKTKYVIYILKSSGEDGYFIFLKDGLFGVYEVRLADSTSRAKWFDTEESAKFSSSAASDVYKRQRVEYD